MKPLYKSPLQKKMYEIIFESETPAGKFFDVSLLILIATSILALFIESIPGVLKDHGYFFFFLELVFTLLFTIEYLLRIWCSPRPRRYIFSFYGIVDLLAILPTYLSFFFPHLHFLLIIRSFRLLRVFRVLGMVLYLKESLLLIKALWHARRKILVFFLSVIIISMVTGVIMYIIEEPHNSGFSSIPQSIYWAIVTLTTVGYGDIAPVTVAGKFIASFIMLLGYCIIAVPTGIFAASIIHQIAGKSDYNTERCPACFREGHDKNATYCKYCGQHL